MANTYQIKKGDTLSDIARAQGTTVAALQKANNITDPNKIYAGQSLMLSPTSQAIAADSLMTPTPPPVIPNPTDNRGSRNQLGVVADTVVNTKPAPVIKDIKDVNNVSGVASFFKNLIGIQGTKGDFQSKLYDKEGVADKTTELADVNNEALLVKDSYERQIKEVEKNAEGKLAGVLNAEVNDLRAKANDELANIGIRQLVAQNNLAAAQKVVADKVAAKFEPIENQIQSLKDLFSIYQNDMSESEKFEAQNAIDEKRSKADSLSNAYSTALKLAIDNGAPAEVLSAIDSAAANPNATEAQIYSALGSYGQNALEVQAKIAQINAANRSNQGDDEDGPTLRDDISSMANQLGTVAGPDGFIAPSDYALAKREWVKAGYSAKDFDVTFSPFRNPQNFDYATDQ